MALSTVGSAILVQLALGYIKKQAKRILGHMMEATFSMASALVSSSRFLPEFLT